MIVRLYCVTFGIEKVEDAWLIFFFSFGKETKINLQETNIFLHSEDTSGFNMGSWPDSSY